MAKKPAIALLPPKAAPTTPDAFVLAGQPEPVPEVPQAKPKRLTIDIDPDLHQAFKLASVAAGRDMRDIMTDLIAGYVAGKR